MLDRLLASLLRLWEVVFPTPRLPLPPGSVVLVLDVLEPYAYLWSATKQASLLRLLSDARRSECRVLFTRWARTRAHPEDVIQKKGHWTEFLPTPDSPLLPDLRQREDPLFPVLFANAFASEEVEREIGRPPALVLAGMWTEACVYRTAVAAAERNIPTYVPTHVVAGHPVSHTWSLWTIHTLFATVCGSVRFGA